MATLNVVTDLSKTPLTRQDIYDAWSTASLGTIVPADLTLGFSSVEVVTSYSDSAANPGPGALLWVAEEQTLYCWHDELDDTGVSLWLAIGPDMFETACLLAEPAFPGALVEPYYDRWVAPVPYTGSILNDGVRCRMIGNVHSGVPYPLNTRTPETLASGTWVRVGIDGFVFGWVPNASGISEDYFAVGETQGIGAAPIDDEHSTEGMKGGLIQTTPASGRHGTAHPYFGFCGHSLYASFGGDPQTEWGQHIRYRFIGFSDQQDRTP